MARPFGRHAVLVVSVAGEWRPSSLNAVPREVSSSRFYVRRAPLYKAIAVAEQYNRDRLPGSGTPDGTWALTVLSLAIRRDSISRPLVQAGAR
jgi:hypothetical protein